MRPSIALVVQAEEIRKSAAVHGLADVRVFGSVVTGADDERSDIDLLVRTLVSTSLFDLGAFSADVTALTGFPVDILTEFQAEAPAYRHVRDEAQPL